MEVRTNTTVFILNLENATKVLNDHISMMSFHLPNAFSVRNSLLKCLSSHGLIAEGCKLPWFPSHYLELEKWNAVVEMKQVDGEDRAMKTTLELQDITIEIKNYLKEIWTKRNKDEELGSGNIKNIRQEEYNYSRN